MDTLTQYKDVKIGEQILETEEGLHPELTDERKEFIYTVFEIKQYSPKVVGLGLRDIKDGKEISINYQDLESVLSDGVSKRFKKM